MNNIRATIYVFLTLAAGSAMALDITGGKLSLTLNEAKKGTITRVLIREGDTSAEFGLADAVVPLFILRASQIGEEPGLYPIISVPASDAEIFSVQKQNAEHVTLRYEKFPKAIDYVECTASVRPEDGMIRWEITASIKDGWKVENTIYPQIPLSPAPNGNAEDVAFLPGSTKGGVIRTSKELKKLTAVWRQPYTLAAAFASYTTGAFGFYTAAEDNGLSTKELWAKWENECFVLRWDRPCFERKTFSQPYAIVTGGFTGKPADWRDAADIYKTWALKQVWCAQRLTERKDLPAWMKDAPVITRFSGKSWFFPENNMEKWIKDYWLKKYSRMPLLAALWGWEKHGYWITPDYFPPVSGKADFTKTVDMLRKNGCHAFPWPSGYRWTLSHNRKEDGSVEWEDLTQFAKVGVEHAIYRRNSTLLFERPSWLRGGTCTWLCGGDPWTIDFWNNKICAPLCEMGCDMIQVDQNVGGNFPTCYKSSHGHPIGCGAWKGKAFERQLITMTQTMKKIQPESVVCYEEPNDWYNHLVGIQDYRDTESCYEWASVFNYIYHEFLPCFQSNPHRDDRVMEAHCFADGQMPFLTPKLSDLSNDVLVNGGFEAKKPNSSAYIGWEKMNGYKGAVWSGHAESDFSIKHSGDSSLRLENQKDEIVQVSQNFSTLECPENSRLRLSAWLKTETMARHCDIDFCFFNGAGKVIPAKKTRDLLFPKEGKDWTQVSCEFTMPTNITVMRVMINGRGKARVWVDDVLLEKAQENGSFVEVKKTKADSHLAFHRRWTDLYHGEGRAWLAHGVILHPPKLLCDTQPYKNGNWKVSRNIPVIFHNAFRAADGKEAVILVNATRKPQTGTLIWKEKERSITVEPNDAILLKE